MHTQLGTASLHIFGLRLRFHFWFFVLVLGFVLLDREILAYYLALPIAVHEGGHLLLLGLFGVRVEEIAFTPFSVAIRRSRERQLSYGREIAVNLAGVVANGLMALYLYLFCFQSVRVMFLIGANLAVAFFNLLPIGDLDGGLVLRLLGERFGAPELAWRLSKWVSLAALIPLFALAILLCLRGMPNPTLFVMIVYLAATVIARD